MFGKPCLVKGCRNHTSHGAFIGEICSPCFDMLISGNPKYGMSFVHEMRDRVEELEDKLVTTVEALEQVLLEYDHLDNEEPASMTSAVLEARAILRTIIKKKISHD